MNEELQQFAEMKKAVDESYGLLSNFGPSLWGPDMDGTFWQPIGPGVAGGQPLTESALYYYQTPYFNLIQRVQGLWLYKNNGFAISGISSLVNMVIGTGFQYICDSPREQDRLDNWMHANDYEHRSREAFEKLLTTGEVFYRLTGDEVEKDKIRFVQPGRVHDGATPKSAATSNNGIVSNPNDYEDIYGYMIDGAEVPAAEVQHRKLGWTEDKRGTSILFAIGPALIEASGLLFSLARTAKTLSKFAGVRYIDGDQQAAEAFRSKIRGATSPPIQVGLGVVDIPYGYNSGNRCDNEEYYRPGTFLDIPKAVKVDFPGQYIDGDKYVSVLRAVLRLAAARFGLPENVLSQDQDSIAAYNGQLVADAHCTKGLRAWQKRLVHWDLELFGKAGFDTKRIKAELPEVAVNDKESQAKVAKFLLGAKLAAPSTAAAGFGLDYDAEKEQMVAQGVDPTPPDYAAQPDGDGEDSQNKDSK